MGKRKIYFIYTKTLAFYFLIAFLILLLAINSKTSVASAKEALILCYRALIPSLFPFFVLSGILIRTGFVKVLGEVLSPLVRAMFNISGEGAFAFAIGIISGYPMGAKVVAELYREGIIAENEAERLLGFCNNSGPLFIIGAIGVGMFGDSALGMKLYLIHILSAVFVGFFFKWFGVKKIAKKELGIKSMVGIQLRKVISGKRQSFGKILSETVSSSVNTMMLICGFVVLFSVVTDCLMPIIDALITNEAIKLFGNGMLEITAGISKISEYIKMLPDFKMQMISFLLGFGGICVHLQVLGVISGSGLKMRTYIFGKVLQAFFALIIAFVLF